MYVLQIRRIYAAAGPADGYRVLVDRLWPRGVRKDEAKLDGWARDIAPTAALRKRFGHQAERFAEFRESYRAELDANPAARGFVRSCETLLATRSITLLYAAKDENANNAAVLRAWICEQMERDGHSGRKVQQDLPRGGTAADVR